MFRSQPKLDNFQSKNQHRATAAATVAVVVAVVAQIVVSCSKNGRARGAVRETPDPEIGPNFAEGDLFSAPIFGHPPVPHFFVFCAKLVSKQLPKWGPFLRRLTLLKCSK